MVEDETPGEAGENLPAGWYDDPEMVDTVRYFDGEFWTDQVAPARTHRDEDEDDAEQVGAGAAAAGVKKADPAAQVAGIGCLVVLGIFAVLMAWGMASGDDEDDATDKYGAQNVCEQFIEDRLKAPSTADFHHDSATAAGDVWTVSGAVDSENGFGAMIRSDYVCQVRATDNDGNWRLVDLQVE